MIEDFINALKKYTNEPVIDYELMNGSQNKVYLCITPKNKYIVKQYSKDACKNYKELKERKEQIRISKIWNEHGINCIIPLTDIFKYQNRYYIIYPYFEGKIIHHDELSLKQLKILAQTQAKIHNLNITSTLSCHTRTIPYTHPCLKELIKKNNEAVKIAKKNMVVCHNDYKPLNIIWKKDIPYLIDFDAVYKNHPTFSLLESALTFTHKGSNIDFKLYKEYIKAYKSVFKKELKDIDYAIYACWNGKIQWMYYLTNKDPAKIPTHDMTIHMLEYLKHKDELLDIIKNA